ncbi:MAG: DUF4870 domain-containing protein [Bacillota bacterium]
MVTTEQKLLCAIAHLGWIVGFPILAPLVVMLVSNDKFVKNQAKEGLVFQVSIIILGFVFALLSVVLIGIPLLVALGIAAIVLPIIAVIKVCDGIEFSYPLTGVIAKSIFS